jgi:hypothetical protein
VHQVAPAAFAAGEALILEDASADDDPARGAVAEVGQDDDRVAAPREQRAKRGQSNF